MSEQLVDERIVAMQFNNSQFEKNVSTSINTLDKLKDSLKLDGAAKSLENINSESDKMHFSVLSGAVEKVHEKFSALEVMGVTALANIANSAVNAGKRILNSLTMEPVKEGFGEYELKMGSIQTIMNGTGESLETVNSYLDELNTYADKTIYSFSDMTTNIGKFTNSGVKLKDAVKAIQGVSNEAAVSGANAQQASHAMYNFAQALSSGSVKLIDWKSIENANMATVEFKQTLIDTAVELGTLEKDGDKYISTTTDMNGHVSDLFDSTSNFNDSLKAEWMTSEVLIKTLGKYADETTDLGKKSFAAAQDVKTFSQLLDTLKEAAGSGWATTWEIVFGDFEESKKLWTGLSNTIGGFIDRQAKARNQLLKTWEAFGGKKDLIEAFKNIFAGIKQIVEPLRDALRMFIPPMTVEQLMRFSTGLKNLTARFKMSDETSKKLKNTFKGLASIIGLVKNVISAVYRSIKPLLNSLGESGLIGKILGVTGAIGRWLYTTNRMIIGNDTIYKSIQILIRYIKFGIDYLKSALHLPELSEAQEGILQFLNLITEKIKALGELGSTGVRAFCDKISAVFRRKIETPGLDAVNDKLDAVESAPPNIFDAFNKLWINLRGLFDSITNRIKNSKIGKFFTALFRVIKKVANAISLVVGAAVKEIVAIIKRSNYKSLLNAVKSISILSITAGVSKLLKTVKELFKTLKKPAGKLKGLVNSAKKALDGVRGCLEAYQTKLKASALKEIAIAIAILAAAIAVLSLLDSEKVLAATGAISILFADLMGSLALFTKMSGSMKKTNRLMSIMLTMSISILILASALKKVGQLSSDEVARGTAGIVAMTATLIGASKILSKNEKKMMKGVIGMMGFAIVLKMLASTVKSLSKLNFGELVTGLIGVGALLAEIALFLKNGTFDNNKGLIKSAIGMILISTAMKILSSVCKTFASMNVGEMIKGLLGASVMLEEMSEFVKSINEKKIFSTSVALIAVATALKIVGSVCKGLAKLEFDELLKGLTGVGVLLYELSAFVNSIDNKKILKTSVSLIAVGAALKIIASACKSLGSLDWDDLIKGLVGVGVLLYELSTFIDTINDKKILKTSVSMIALGAALKILASVCKDIGELQVDDLIKGLVGIGVMLKEFSVFSDSMNKSENSPKKIIASCLSIIAMGESVKSLASSFMSFKEIGWEDIIKGLVATGALLLEVYVFSKLLSKMPQKFGGGVFTAGEVLGGMAAGLAAFAGACKVLSKIGWDGLIIALAAMAASFAYIILAAKFLTPVIPEILAFSGALALMGASFIAFGVGLAAIGLGLAAFSAGLLAFASASAIAKTEIAAAITTVITEFADMIPILAKKAAEGILEFCKTIRESAPEVAQTIKEVIVAFVYTMNDTIPMLVQSLLSLLKTIIDSAYEYIPDIVDKLLLLVVDILKILSNRMPEIVSAIIDVVASFFTAVYDAFNNMDAGTFESMLSGISIVAEMLLVLAGLGALAVPAMAGVLALGALVVELSAVLAALGALEQIPGINWIIGEGGKLLGAIGEAIGSFLGGLLGSAMEGIASKLPDVGKNLSAFFEEAEPFISGASKLNASSMDGIKALVDVILMLTGANVLESITAWLTGGSSLSKFGKELASFGPSLSTYYNSIKNVKGDVVKSSADAASALAQMSKKLPKHGGIIKDWFIGDATLTTFAKELLSFGPAMKSYYLSVKDVKGDVVTASADAASALAEMAGKLPKHGGFTEWFTGSATLTTFATELLSFGPAMSSYYHQVKDIKGDVVTASANAAASLAEMAHKLPAHNGVVQWFTGDATLATFANELLSFGPAMQSYSDMVAGIKPEAVEASANAALMLTEVNNNLPETGGLRGFINGDKSLVEFANGLSELGPAIQKYAEGSEGIKVEGLKASIEVVEALAKINQELPETGGLKQVFTGEKNLGKWVSDLDDVGKKIKAYADNVSEINTDGLMLSVRVLEGLAEVNQSIPTKGGLKDIWEGEKDLGKWVDALDKVGDKIKSYAANVLGINTDGLDASITAIKALADANAAIPEKGGLKDIWEGKRDFGEWAASMGTIGEDIKKYADSVEGIKTTGLAASVDAIKTLAEANEHIPSQGGFNKIFTGEQSLEKFGEQIARLGVHLVGFCNSMGSDSVDADKMTKAADVVLALAKSAQALVGAADEHEFEVFSTSVPKLADGVRLLYAHLHNAGLLSSTEAFRKAIDIIMEIVKVGIELNKMDYKRVYENFGESLGKMASEGLDTFADTFSNSEERIREVANGFVKTFTEALEDSTKSPTGLVYLFMTAFAAYFVKELNDIEKEWKDSGHDMINNLSAGLYEQNTNKLSKTIPNILTMMLTDAQKNEYKFRSVGNSIVTELSKGIEEKKNVANDKADQVVTWIILPIKGSYSKFNEIGSYLVDGFAAGISANKAKAEEAAAELAKAASDSAKKKLDEHSPSKVGYRIGDYFGLGFINAIQERIPDSYSAGSDIADSARQGLTNAISRINGFVDENIDANPTIRPVLDLSELTKEAQAIDGMFGANQTIFLARNSSAGFNANRSSTKEMRVDNTDVISEIGSLKEEVAGLNDVIRNMKVVMDTGALVGSITAPMNVALGRRVAYDRRGN